MEVLKACLLKSANRNAMILLSRNFSASSAKNV